MYIETVPNRASPPAILLRESTRLGRQVRKRTLANLTHWPAAKIAALRRVLRGERLGGDPASSLAISASLPHGHVKAVLRVIRKVGLDRLIASRRCRQRDLVLAMIAARILFPTSKLDTIAQWKQCTLAEELAVGDADEDELYAALDWLLGRQAAIENKLAGRHLSEGGSVLYDLSSSYYYGSHCPLAKFGHDRDGKKGLMVIVYGVLASAQGCPVATQVYAGNTSDPRTVADQATKLRDHFGLERAVLVGDRGCITQAQIKTLKEHPGLGWIGALRSTAIRKLLDQKVIQPSLFDQQNLAEITCADYPNERLVACFNPLLAEERRRKRQDLLAATEKLLEKIAADVKRRKKILSKSEIGLKVGRVINRYKMAKHFEVNIGEGSFDYNRRMEAIEREEQMDGIYVVRTSEPADRLPAVDAVRGYKALAHVERAFRCLKGVDLLVRPIYLRTEAHVRGHIFLCLLAYYVEWHMRRALAPLLYEDEEMEKLRRVRDPVLPAQASQSVKIKKAEHRTEDGLPVQKWSSLIGSLRTMSRNTCRMKDDPDGPSFVVQADANDLQRRAFELLECTQYDEAPV